MKYKLSLFISLAILLCCTVHISIAESDEMITWMVEETSATDAQRNEICNISDEWLNIVIPENARFSAAVNGQFITAYLPDCMILVDKYENGQISAIHLSYPEYDESTNVAHLSNAEKLEHFKTRLSELPIFQREDLLSDGGTLLLYEVCIPYPATDERNDEQLKWQWQVLHINQDEEMLLDNKLVLISWDPLLDRITDIIFRPLAFY